MGVLDDAIREHLDLKRRRGASDEEIARAEAEALTPARRPPTGLNELDEDGKPRDPGDDHGDEPASRRVIEPVADVAPPPTPTDAVHDIDEDPMPAPARGHEAPHSDDTVEADPIDIPTPDDDVRDPGRLSD